MQLGWRGKKGKHAKRVRERGAGTKCTEKRPHMTRKRKREAMAPRWCRGNGQKERGIRGERKGEERRDGGGAAENATTPRKARSALTWRRSGIESLNTGPRREERQAGGGGRGEKQAAPRGVGRREKKKKKDEKGRGTWWSAGPATDQRGPVDECKHSDGHRAGW